MPHLMVSAFQLLVGAAFTTACILPTTPIPTTITDGFGLRIENPAMPQIHNHYMNLVEAGGGDQHLFVSPTGVDTFNLLLRDGVIGRGVLNAVINGEYNVLDNTTKMFMTERGDPRALWAPVWACNPDNDQVEIVLSFLGRQTYAPGGAMGVRGAQFYSFDFRYKPPDNTLSNPNDPWYPTTLVLVRAAGVNYYPSSFSTASSSSSTASSTSTSTASSTSIATSSTSTTTATGISTTFSTSTSSTAATSTSTTSTTSTSSTPATSTSTTSTTSTPSTPATSTSTTSTTSTSTTSSRSSTSSSASATPTGPTQPATISGGWTWYGCRTEATNQRALTGATFAADTLTLEACAAFCSNFAFFGTEYARECYCGNSFNAGSVPAPAPDCNFLCKGNSLEYCGAGLRLSVYSRDAVVQPGGSSSSSSSTSASSAGGTSISSTSTTTSTSTSTATSATLPYTDETAKGFAFVGCSPEERRATDGPGRTLSGALYADDTMTNEKCMDYCRTQGYAFAGTEWRRECWCGNSVAPGRQPQTTVASLAACNLPCGGAPSQYCGGDAWLSLYKACAPGSPCVNAQFT